MKKNLFIASTHYQLINVINMVMTFYNNDENDIVLLKINDKCSELYDICSKSLLFNNISIVDIGNQYEKNKFKYIKKRIIFAKKVKKYIENPLKEYDCIFIVDTEIFSKAIFYHYRKLNYKTKLVYYEDGTGSYSYLFLKNKRIFNKILLKVLFGYNLDRKCSLLYVYEPSLVQNDYKNIVIKKLPKLNVDGEVYGLLRKLYLGFKSEQIIGSKDVIIFDSDWNKKSISDFQKSIFSVLIDKYGAVMKLHPSSAKNKYGTNVSYWNSKIGFEMELLLGNFQGNTLISVFSTACIVPKLVFDTDLEVIFLYKIIDSKLKMFSNSDKFVSSIIKNMGANVIVPDSKEELYNLLEKKK